MGGDRHVDVLITQNAKAGEKFSYFIEVACNGMSRNTKLFSSLNLGMFGNGYNGLINGKIK